MHPTLTRTLRLLGVLEAGRREELRQRRGTLSFEQAIAEPARLGDGVRTSECPCTGAPDPQDGAP